MKKVFLVLFSVLLVMVYIQTIIKKKDLEIKDNNIKEVSKKDTVPFKMKSDSFMRSIKKLSITNTRENHPVDVALNKKERIKSIVIAEDKNTTLEKESSVSNEENSSNEIIAMKDQEELDD